MEPYNVLIRVFVFPSPGPFAWLPALVLAPNLYLAALAPNLYFPALNPLLDSWPRPPGLVPNLYLPALAPNLYLPALTPNLFLPALTPNLCLPQICIYRFNPAWVCIYWSCIPNLYLLALVYDSYAHRLLSWFTYNDAE